MDGPAKQELVELLADLNEDVEPLMTEVVEVSPELPSGGTSHCSVSS